jgi:uncharacterized protein (TIGR02453 family)
MLQSQTIQFIQNLKENNNKPWFDENRKVYEVAKKDFASLVEMLIKGIGQFDKNIEEANLQPKDCMFRINRDVRFSKNKDPYKTNFGAWFCKGRKNATSAGYYLHIDPTECFLAGGLWMPEAENLKKIRAEIDYNFEEFSNILNENSFKKTFTNGLDRDSATVRPPKGYDEANPAIEFIKLKSFTVSSKFDSKMVFDSNFSDTMLEGFKAMQTYVAFLNRAIEG